MAFGYPFNFSIEFYSLLQTPTLAHIFLLIKVVLLDYFAILAPGKSVPTQYLFLNNTILPSREQ